MTLCQDYLSARGITNQTVKIHGLELDDRLCGLPADIVKKRLGRGLPEGVNEVIWIPIYDERGKIISWIARILPTIGNLGKFLCPLGSNGLPYVPRNVYNLARGKPLILTEGPIKALVCVQAGFDAIGMNGVWCAASQTPGNKLVLRKEIVSLCDLRGRKVYIAFDADAGINGDVRRAAIRLFFLLYEAGAETYQLTSWDVSDGKGLDDYLVNTIRADPQATAGSVLSMLINDAAPFLDTITKNGVDTAAIETELERVLLSSLYRDQLCHDLAFRLKVKADLLRQIGRPSSGAKNTLGPIPDPTPAPHPVDGEVLLHDVSAMVKKHVIMDEHSLVAVTLWIALTYLADVADVLPLLGIRSPDKRCGKTKLLAVLNRLVRAPLPSCNISPAALYRVIEKFTPCLLIDEADSVFEKNDELRTLINSGHTRDSAFVLRANRDSGDVERFSTWGAKAIALIGKLPGTLADRSLTVAMKRKTKGEKIDSLRKTPVNDFEKLRGRLLRWAEDNKAKIATCDPKLPALLNDRAADNWFPLLAIAQTAGQDWVDLAVKAIAGLGADDDEDSLVTVLLVSLQKLFYKPNQPPIDFLSTPDILAGLNSDHEAPWADFRDGQGLSQQRLRSILVPFGVRSFRQTTGSQKRGYQLKDLQPVFDRYL
jgi:putative DNA primase/helicase